jgi:hypothetical protein
MIELTPEKNNLKGGCRMSAQKYQVDPTIEQWHHNFDEVQKLWAEWCAINATRFDTAVEAWGAFIKEYQQQTSYSGNASAWPGTRLSI